MKSLAYRLILLLIPCVALLATSLDVGADQRFRVPNRSLSIMKARPSVVENGTDVVLFPHFSGYEPRGADHLTFTPDSTAYFTYAAGILAQFSPDGTLTLEAVPHLLGDVLFAHGSLWLACDNGIIRMNTDGSRRRFFQIKNGTYGRFLLGNGDLYFSTYDSSTSSFTIRSIDVHGDITTRYPPNFYEPETELAWGADSKVYFGSNGYSDGMYGDYLGGIVRVEASGAPTFLPLPEVFVSVSAIARARGSIYFATSNEGTNNVTEYIWRLDPNGVMTKLTAIVSSTASGNDQIQHFSVDQGGNIWFTFNGGLYVFNTVTQHISGPFEPSLLRVVDGVSVAPDDNVWVVDQTYDLGYSTFGVYVKHVQTLDPAAVTISAGKTASFTVLETHFAGPWTASSSNSAIASVASPVSSTGAFTVRAIGTGTTTIGVRDRYGNTIYEAVTVQ